MTNESFLPSGYQAPASGGFTKLEAGDTTLRILSNPLLCWVVWENGIVKRLPYVVNGVVTEKPTVSAGEKNSVNFAWCLIVWNYKTNQIEVCELTQKTCQSGIEGYSVNTQWGHPSKYDVIINKTGSGKEGTKYALRVNPPSPASQQIIDAFNETPIDLNQLLVNGGNPFLPAAANSANLNTQPASTGSKVVTSENWAPGDTIPAGYKMNPDGSQTIVRNTPF